MNENSLSFEQIKRVGLHDISLREIKKGHPWITRDQFTKKFPQHHFFLFGCDRNRREICLFINDPDHPKIKGRVWQKFPFSKTGSIDFATEFRTRIGKSIAKRAQANLLNERENFYLVFAEADQRPGLFVQMVGDQIIVQIYAYFWKDLIGLIEEELIANLQTFFSDIRFEIWVQERRGPENLEINSLQRLKGKKAKTHKLIIQEFEVQYLLHIKKNYDLGIFSDMASVRKSLIPYFSASKSLLNLYSYTGAFSLFPLKKGTKHVTSVDLSEKYMQWLEQNLSLNPEIKLNRHQSICQPVTKAVKELQKKHQKFDFIICDPPTSSSDGNKKSSSFNSYSNLLPELNNLLHSGGHLLLFLNTHQIGLQKFRSQINKTLTATGLKKLYTEKQCFGLGEDCPTLRGFREGSYLKGILLAKKN